MQMANKFQIGEYLIGRSERKIFIVAEIGQNHQGCLELAKKMIFEAKKAGCDCVKFQKSDLNMKYTKSALERPYINENSWGNTYLRHKEFLEFSLNEVKELKKFADNLGIYFAVSAMDSVSLEHLNSLNLPFIKIGSGDANNFPLLKKAAKLSVPLIISTGMQNISTIDEIVKIMYESNKKNFCFLHCVSSYPTEPEDASLLTISFLQKRYPFHVIGYSGHEQGILLSQASILLGAKILERHFTLDKNIKGTDHKCSLTPNELKRLVQFVTKFEKMNYIPKTTTGPTEIEEILRKEVEDFSNTDSNVLKLALKPIIKKSILPSELQCRKKLGKSLVYSCNLEKGHILQETDILVKVSEPFGITAENINEIVGKKLNKDVLFDDCIMELDLVFLKKLRIKIFCSLLRHFYTLEVENYR